MTTRTGWSQPRACPRPHRLQRDRRQRGGQHHLRCLQQHLPGSDGDQFFRERLPEFLRECDELAVCFFGVCGVLVVGAVVRAGHVPAAQG